jgi:alkanesulfonate monooxygenase SsuD/methylene tetrahydromethanopterin reductase-like flavin-dependent oxidoreductase (luciferase family)
VVNVGNRHPGVLANCAATIQNISNGRHMLGLGAGGGAKNPTAAERLAIGIVPPETMAERHAALVRVLDVLDDMWSPNRREVFDTFPLPSPRPPVVLGVNSTALATIAGERTNGVNIRASNETAPDILRTAIDAHNASGVDKPFTATVWEFFDEALLRGDDDRLALWQSWGVDRVILLMFTGIDVDAIRAAVKYLR